MYIRVLCAFFHALKTYIQGQFCQALRNSGSLRSVHDCMQGVCILEHSLMWMFNWNIIRMALRSRHRNVDCKQQFQRFVLCNFLARTQFLIFKISLRRTQKLLFTMFMQWPRFKKREKNGKYLVAFLSWHGFTMTLGCVRVMLCFFPTLFLWCKEG